MQVPLIKEIQVACNNPFATVHGLPFSLAIVKCLYTEHESASAVWLDLGGRQFFLFDLGGLEQQTRSGQV